MNQIERIERLERLISRQRITGALLLGGLALTAGTRLVSAASDPQKDLQELRVTKLVVVDKKGNERIVLGEGAVVLRDEHGKDRIAIFTNSGNFAEARINDAGGNNRISIFTDPQLNVGAIALYSPETQEAARIVTGVDGKGGAFTRYNDAKGRRSIDIGTSGDGFAMEAFYDKSDNSLINTGVAKGVAFMRIFDARGNLLSKQP